MMPGRKTRKIKLIFLVLYKENEKRKMEDGVVTSIAQSERIIV